MVEADAIVVGGGPAGSSCAAEFVRAGFSVVVLDKAVFPRDKLCAGWIPPSLFRLIGVEPDAYPHGIREYRSLHLRVKGLPVPIPTRQYAIRRYEFDAWLLERSGADLHHHRVRNIKRKEGKFVIDGKFSCRFLIGAGGTGCPVARWLRGGGQQGNRPEAASERGRSAEGELIVTMEEEFTYPVQDESCYLRFFDRGLNGYSWYFPKADGFLTVGIGGKQRELRKNGESIREHWNSFIIHLEKRGLVVGRSFAPSGHSYYLRSDQPLLGADGVYLVGDAAHLATVDFGEGIEPAVHSGRLAARAIIEETAYTVDGVKRKSLPDILRP